MLFEVSLSLVATVLLLVMSYFTRKTVYSIHLFAIAVFCASLNLLKIAFGSEPSHVSDDVVFYSYFAVTVYGGSIFLSSMFLGGATLKRTVGGLNLNSDTGDLKIFLVVIAIAWVVRIYIALAYGILFSGSGTEDAISSLPYFVSTANSLISLLAGGALVKIITVALRGEKKWLWIVVFTEFIFMYMSAGRRELLFFAFLLCAVGYITKTLNARSILVISVVFLIFIYATSGFFLSVRNLYSNDIFHGRSVYSSAISSLTVAGENCFVEGKCSGAVSKNISDRGNTMEFLKGVVSKSQKTHSYLLGDGFSIAFLWTIPSVFIKKPELPTEQYVQMRFGLPLVDDAISMPALAFADGGVLGCFLIGIFVAIYIRLYTDFAQRQKSEFLRILLFFGLFKMLWNIEYDPSQYIVTLRDSLILVLFFKINKIRFNRRSAN